MAHIIVVGNEKGGSGKSTTTMHLATALARMGHRVGGLDLDLRQKTFGQYVSNRLRYAAQIDITLQSPNYIELPEIAKPILIRARIWRTAGCRALSKCWSRSLISF